MSAATGERLRLDHLHGLSVTAHCADRALGELRFALVFPHAPAQERRIREAERALEEIYGAARVGLIRYGAE